MTQGPGGGGGQPGGGGMPKSRQMAGGGGGQGQQCPFCQLVAAPEQTFDVHESAHFKAWLDINPRARGHTMIVPKEHQTGFDELGPDLVAEMFEVIYAVAEKAKRGLGAAGVSIVINEGEAAGQNLDHFYAQVFPRFQGEENEGAPAGAVFQPIDELDENDLDEISGQMEDVSVDTGSSSGGPATDMARRKRGELPQDADADRAEQSHQDADEEDEDDGYYGGDGAEFR